MADGNFKDLNKKHNQIKFSEIKPLKLQKTIFGGLADMQLISKYNNELSFYYAQFIFLHGLFFWKIKKELVLLMHFNKLLVNWKRKPNKIWVDQSGEFYNSQFRKVLKDNNIEMYSTYNEGKSIVAERFIKAYEK